MLHKFYRTLSITALLSAATTSAQNPDYVAPLWQNTGSAAPVPLSSTPPASSAALTQAPAYAPPPSGGFAPLSAPQTTSPEIASLAEALGNDPVKIFNHVRNTIDYEQYFGQRKGPELTLLEGSGNDLDT